MRITHQSYIAGRFKLAAHCSNGAIARELPWQDNLITDVGLDMWLTWATLGYCVVGTGSAPPAVTDTALAAYQAVSSTIISTVLTFNVEENYWSIVLRYRFAEGVAAGNLTELGLTDTNNILNMRLFSRALITDNGDPVTFPVKANEYLEVTYEVRVYFPIQDYVVELPVDTRLMPAQTLTLTHRTAAINQPQNVVSKIRNYLRVSAYQGTMVNTTGTPTDIIDSSSVAAILVDWQPYTSGANKRVGKFTVAPNLWALTEIRTLRFGDRNNGSPNTYQSPVGLQVGFDPPLQKDAVETLVITLELAVARRT